MADEQTPPEPHPELRKARRGGVRMVTQLLSRPDNELVFQAIGALEEMLSTTEPDESFAGMDGYNLTIDIAKNPSSDANLKTKALTLLGNLPSPSKMDVDNEKLKELVNMVVSEKDDASRIAVATTLARLSVYEDWKTGLTLRGDILNTVIDQIKASPNTHYYHLHILAALSDLDEVSALSPEDAAVISEAFSSCPEEVRETLLGPLSKLLGKLGKKIPLNSVGPIIAKFLYSTKPETQAHASKILEILSEYDRRTVAGLMGEITGLLTKPGFESVGLSLLRKFSISSAMTVAMVEKGVIKSLLSVLGSSDVTNEIKEEARSILKRIVEEPENKVKIVSEGQLTDILNSLDKESGEEILSALSFESFCERGNLPISIAKMLLDSGADPSINDNISIAYAAANGSLELVNLLLQDPRVNPAANNNAAIRRAAAKGHAEIVEILLKDPRVDPSASGNSSIISACESGHVDVFGLLIGDTRIDVQLTVLAVAAIKGGSLKILQELIKMSSFADELQSTGTDILAEAIQWHRRDMVELMLITDPIQGIIDPSAHDNQAIQWASRNGFAEIVDLLLYDSRVDPTANDNNSIKQAVFNNHKEVLELLLKDRRCDPSVDENLILRHACKNGFGEIVRLLLDDPSVDPSAQENFAIRIAAKNGYETIVDDLLAHDLVDPSDVNNEAIINAVTEGQTNIVRMLCLDRRVDPSARYCA